jgi:hypothetical protein
VYFATLVTGTKDQSGDAIDPQNQGNGHSQVTATGTAQ